eukprot:Amastigsp_a952_278.p6 type:complete len:120 gc:universal Amastigsp_a952_278:665-306(-)
MTSAALRSIRSMIAWRWRAMLSDDSSICTCASFHAWNPALTCWRVNAATCAATGSKSAFAASRAAMASLSFDSRAGRLAAVAEVTFSWALRTASSALASVLPRVSRSRSRTRSSCHIAM